MKKGLIWAALAALLLPFLLRLAWFYSGIPERTAIATPDYQSLQLPQPPVEVTAAPQEIPLLGGIVLVDTTHENQFQPGEIQSLREAVEARGGRMENLTDSSMLEYGLRYARAFVTVSPSIQFTDEEINLLADFVTQGGRLLIFTDATRGMLYTDYITYNPILWPDVYAVNPLLAKFGLTINNDYLYDIEENEANFRNVYFDQFGKNELTFGLKRVTFYGTHSVKADPGLVLLLGAESTLSSVTDAHHPDAGGAALSADGNVAAFGDFTFLSQPYQNTADNPTLIANLADFLLGGEREIRLVNFPYLFTQPAVQVYAPPEVQMTAEMIAAMSGLQAMLHALNHQMIVTPELEDGDAIILGTYAPSEELLAYLEPFGITLDETSEYVEVTGLGKVGRAGNALILFHAGANGNTLILLADSMEDLASLFDSLRGGDLDGCLVQGNLGVCRVGFGGSFSTENAEPTEEPAQEATPEG